MKEIFEGKDYFLSCDWGTSSFRLTLVDRKTSTPVEQCSTSNGIKKMYHQWTQGDTKRETFFLDYLDKQIKKIEKRAEQSLEDTPIIISGMASSSIGITELPYASVPFSLTNPTLSSKIISSTKQFPHEVLLISGLQTNSDVMRGEEVQLLGLAANHEVEECICIMPGTHSKHTFIKEKKVVDFKTYMTGEVFELLSSQSILSGSLTSSDSLNKKVFEKGVEQAREENLLHSIFQIRTNDLLLGLDQQSNYDLLSGLIIGSEITALSNTSINKLYIIGSGPLIHRYEAALKFLDFHPTPVPDTDALTLHGHFNIINQNT